MLDELYQAVLSDAAFPEVCRYCVPGDKGCLRDYPWGAARGCFVRVDRGLWLFPEDVALLAVWSGHSDHAAALDHKATHWIGWCAEGDADPGHQSERLRELDAALRRMRERVVRP